MAVQAALFAIRRFISKWLSPSQVRLSFVVMVGGFTNGRLLMFEL